MDYYSRGNDFATRKNFDQNIFGIKCLVDSRGNDFTTIKNFVENFFG